MVSGKSEPVKRPAFPHKPILDLFMEKESRDITRKSLTAVKFTVIFRVLAQGVSLAVTVLLVRVLSEHDYGVYNLLYSVVAMLGMVFSFGIANTIQRYMPEYYSKGEFRIAHNLYKTASLIRLFSNVAVLGLALIFWEQLAPYLKITEYKYYFMFFILVILLHMQRGILETCLSSHFLHKYSQGLSVVFIFIKGIGYSAAFLLKKDLWFVLSVDLIAYLVVFILLNIVYYNKVPLDGGAFKGFTQEERKRVVRYAMFYNFNDAGVGLLDVNIDNFIIAMYLNPIAIGAYSFCNRITKMINNVMPVNYLIDVIRPAFFSSINKDDTSKSNRNFQLLLKLIWLFQLPFFCLLCFFAEEMIFFLFDGKFIAYSKVLIAIYLFNIFGSFYLPLGLIAQIKERADVILYSKFFGIYNLIADIILIKFFGIWGAVFATGTATLAKNFFIWSFFKKEASFRGLEPFMLRIFVIWTGCFAFIYGLKMAITNTLVVLPIAIISVTITFFFQFRFIPLTETEKELLQRLAFESKKLKRILHWTKILTV
jgi:O-antigen/teichoic acid export membrane protein